MAFVTRHAPAATSGRHIASLSSRTAPLPTGEPWNLLLRPSHAWAMEAQAAFESNDLILALQYVDFAYWSADAAGALDATRDLILREEETDLHIEELAEVE